MTTPKPLDADLLKRGGRVPATMNSVATRKTRRKVGVRLDLKRYEAFKALAARTGLTGEQVLERALDRLLAEDTAGAAR